MNKLVKKSLLLGALGFVFGGLVAIFALYPEIFQPGGDKGAAVFNFLVSGVYGFVVWGGTVIYEKEEWGVLKTTLLHFLITIVGFYIMGGLEGWLEFWTTSFYVISLLFVLGYFLIWLFQYLGYKREVARLNKELEQMKAEEKEKS